MNRSIPKLTQASLIILALFCSNTFAQKVVMDEGKVLEINRSSINVSDAQYNLLATTHVVRLPSKREASAQDIKPGDNVRVKLIKIDKKRFVDTIYLLSDKMMKNNPEKEGRRR